MGSAGGGKEPRSVASQDKRRPSPPSSTTASQGRCLGAEARAVGRCRCFQSAFAAARCMKEAIGRETPQYRMCAIADASAQDVVFCGRTACPTHGRNRPFP